MADPQAHIYIYIDTHVCACDFVQYTVSYSLYGVGIRTPAKFIFFAWFVENKGTPKKPEEKKNQGANSGEVAGRPNKFQAQASGFWPGAGSFSRQGYVDPSLL